MAFFLCLGYQRKKCVAKHKQKINHSQENFETLNGLEEILGEASQNSGSTNASTKFLEYHQLPFGFMRTFRHGGRVSGDIIGATGFVEKLLGKEEFVKPSHLVKRLVEIGFEKAEAKALRLIMAQFILENNKQNYDYDNLLPFFSFFFDKAKKTESVVDFGFQLVDLNNDGVLNVTEVAEFLYLFWNGKIENILKTQCAEEYLREFLTGRFVDESLDFYLDMKKALKEPYISKDKYNEVVKKYIESDGKRAINIGSDARNEILNYQEVEEIAKSSLIKSSVFKQAAYDIKYLLSEQVGYFTKDALENENVAEKIFDKLSNNKDWNKATFQSFLVENTAVAAFIGDINTLVLKAREIAVAHITESTSK